MVVQSNGLPEQAHVGGDDSAYPDEEVVGGDEGAGDVVEQSKQSGTWASRIAQVSGWGLKMINCVCVCEEREREIHVVLVRKLSRVCQGCILNLCWLFNF